MMRARYILPLFVLTLFFGAIFAAPSVHAQASSCLDTGCPEGQVCKGSPPTCQANAATCSPACSGATPICNQNSNGTFSCIAATSGQDVTIGTCNPECTGSQVCVVTNGVGSCQASAGSSVDGSTNAAAQKTPALNGSPIDQSSHMLDWLMAELMSLFAWLLGIAAITLDNAMYYTVVHMGSYVNGLSAVGVAWRILRDIGNIVLIFGFVALGINVILDVDWYGGGTKMLPTLLIAALMLNFSLFAAEAVVDVGNLFATEFYTQINGGQPAAPKDWGSTSVSNEGISNAVMNQLGLQEFYNAGVSTGTNGSNVSVIFQTGHPFIIGFMAILIFMIASFVFFSLAFILIARFIVLIFIIIIAPIGFAGLAVPKLEGSAREWWGTLFSQTITAPVMLLMLYVALAVITDTQFLTGFGLNGTGSGASDVAQNAWLGAVTTASGTSIGALASVLLSFLVAMGLLLAVTMLSKRLGAMGGAWATKVGGALSFGLTARAAGYTARATSSTVGFAGRRTVGRASNAMASRLRQSNFGRNTFFGRGTAKVLDAGAKASYDVRGTKLAQTAAKTAGITVGTAPKGGYAGIEKAATDSQIAYAKTLQLTPEEARAKKELEGQLAAAARKRDADLKALGAPTKDNKEDRQAIRERYEETEKEIKDSSYDGQGNPVKKGLDYYNGAPQRIYAQKLKKPLPQPFQALYHLSAGPRAEAGAAKKLLAEANKGQGAKLKEALDKAVGDGGH